MRTYERATDRAARRGRRFLVQVGEELRRLRRRAGLSQSALGSLVGISQSQVSRIEGGRLAVLSIFFAARLLAAVGGELSIRVFAAAIPLHDAGQLKLRDRLRPHLHQSLRLRMEVPLGIPGDPRALDAVATGPGVEVAFELVSRIEDGQALERMLNGKLRDGAPKCLVLVLAGTAHNRAAVRSLVDLRAAFPASGRSILAALRAGHQPAANGIVFL